MFPITEPVQHLSFIVGSGVLSFLTAMLFAKPFIKQLLKHKVGKNIREVTTDGKKAKLFHALHSKKQGTPTMGGILIWGTSLIIILFSRLLSYLGLIDHSLINRKETYLAIFTLVTMALLGAVDDLFGIKGWGKSKGLNVKPKFITITLFALLGALWFFFKLDYNSIHIPGVGDFIIGWWYIPLFMLVIVSSATSVNFTDGLDGLAGGLIIMAFVAFGILAYAKGLLILTAFCAVIAGASTAFLWFNVPPARFIMGDTGSTALGATLGVIAMMTDTLLILPIVGIIFVLETLSVIAQLSSKKLIGKKIFHIAPFHHHFEHIGWPESQIVMRFWIVGGIFAVIGVLLGLVGLGITP